MAHVDEGRYIYNETETPELSAEFNKMSDEDVKNGSSLLFGDGDCGEPISKQRVILDFTPDDDIDNDDVQEKCCAFWEFVNNHPELDNLIVKPKEDTYSYNGIKKSNEMISLPKHKSSISVDLKEDTAVSVLEFVEEKGLISRAFKSKMASSFCDGELKDYSDESLPKARKVRTNAKEKNHKKYKTPKEDTSPQTSVAARNMCQMLQEWDLEHPKSMCPPGPVPQPGFKDST
ncbi:uncharacterized protein LOC125065951 [Vanessa atalanta]|uniref:uncharacterized protein LOC125065951 n=1 Tax=Vanessa atalanta TaxID=42275 RepID=UPI001FCD9622|nr:uncharacterized protein LOC125065951 [Vanessa atalanta]